MAVPAGERLAKLEQKTEDIKTNMTQYHTDMIERLTKLDNKLDEHFVTKEEFSPVKRIAYGFMTAVGLATLGFLGWVIKLILFNGVLL